MSPSKRGFWRFGTFSIVFIAFILAGDIHGQVNGGQGELVFQNGPEAAGFLETLTNAVIDEGTFTFVDFQVAGDPNFYFFDINAQEGVDIFFVIESEGGFEEFSFNEANAFFDFLESAFGLLPPEIQAAIKDLQREAERLKQQVTANAIVETPGGPLDESFSQIALGRSVFSRPYADISGEQGGEDPGQTAAQVSLADQIAAQLKYTRFHFRDVEGNIYGVTLGAQRETGNMRYGVLIPYDRIDFDGTSEDADSFTVTPFLQWILMREPVIVAVGPYLYFNYTFINDAPDFSMYGAGLTGSVEKRWELLWVRLAIAGEYIDANINHPVNNVVRFRYGGTVGIPIVQDKVELRAFAIGTVADEEFLGGDDEFATVGGEIAANITEAFALTFGYMNSVGHEHLTSHTGYLGGIFAVR